eukprot:493388-Pelagomonas_calceolata.AAC.1
MTNTAAKAELGVKGIGVRRLPHLIIALTAGWGQVCQGKQGQQIIFEYTTHRQNWLRRASQRITSLGPPPAVTAVVAAAVLGLVHHSLALQILSARDSINLMIAISHHDHDCRTCRLSVY